MNIEKELHSRCSSTCELCGKKEDLSVYQIPASIKLGLETVLLTCNTCLDQIENPDKIDPNHWRCLNDSMWSQEQAVQIMAWRMLNRLKSEGWPQDLLDMMYLENDVLELAKADGDGLDEDDIVKHIDSNGQVLESGDTVTLTKDLNVKGAGFTAKRGTAVRNIILVKDNAEHIEGRINGQHIVILTKFVKK